MCNYAINLPFPRGSTACGGVNPPVSGNHEQFVGKEYIVHDTIHGTGRPVTLLACKLKTNIVVARKFYKFGTGALEFGRAIAGVNDVQGGPCVALDDAYAVGDTLLANDVAWFVIDGPVGVLTESTAVNLAAHAAVVSDNAGCVDGAPPAAGDAVVGRIDQATTSTNTVVVVHMSRGSVGGEGT